MPIESRPTASHRRRRRRHRPRRPDHDRHPRRARLPRRRAAPAGLARRRPQRGLRRPQLARRQSTTPGGLRGCGHRPLLGRRRSLQGLRAGGRRARRRRHRQLLAVAHGPGRARSWWPASTTRTPRDHEGIIANPNCSTMQLMPVLAALRDSVGIERVIVDTYQAVSGTGNKAVAELEGRSGPGRRRAAASTSVYPHQIAFNALPAHRRLPRRRLHQGGVEGHRRDAQDPAPAGPARLLHGRARPGRHLALGGGPRRAAAAHDRRTRRASSSQPSGRHRP